MADCKRESSARTARIWLATAVPLLVAACNQDGSDNVMAVGANALSPEQVDAALGPELGNVGDVADANAVNAMEAGDTADAVEEAARPDTPVETEPQSADEPQEAAPTDNNSAEE